LATSSQWTSNAVADALSRRDKELTTVHAISTPEFKLLTNFDMNRLHYQRLPPIELKLKQNQRARHGAWSMAL
jgi:hypothetical protein